MFHGIISVLWQGKFQTGMILRNACLNSFVHYNGLDEVCWSIDIIGRK